MSGADIKCQLLANQAMLGGTYKAWISDIFNSPANRFAKSPGPYYLVNGDKVAGSYADLTDGNLDKSINITELDTAVSIPFEVWTHTQTNGLGVVSGAHCSNWSDSAGGSNGDTGNSNLTDAGWTAGAPQPCAGPKRRYCFQQS